MQAGGRRYIVHPSRSDVLKIYCVADMHIGNRGTSLHKLQSDIDSIKNDPNAFWIGGGDYADHISFNDKRFDPSCLSDDITVADLGQLGFVLTRKVRDILKPIANKCLGLLFGNHEDKIQRANQQQELHGWLCSELGVQNLGYCALVDVIFARKQTDKPKLVKAGEVSHHGDRETFRIFLHHGAGSAATPSGKLSRLINFMNSFDADIYFIGHVHDQIAKRIPRITASAGCSKITQRDTLGIVTGSYERTYAEGVIGYGEKRGYAPTPLGAVCVDIRPQGREMHASL